MQSNECVGTLPNPEPNRISREQLQRELDFWRAQKILESMLDRGLLSLSEFNKITGLNRLSFSPAYAEIMPDKR
jgi:hypothetical protein